MSKTRSDVLSDSRRKGVFAGTATALTVGLAAIGTGPFVVVAAAIPTGLLIKNWWKHRAENGIKF